MNYRVLLATASVKAFPVYKGRLEVVSERILVVCLNFKINFFKKITSKSKLFSKIISRERVNP